MLTNDDRVELDRVLTPMLERLTAIEEHLREHDEDSLHAEVADLRARVERAEAMLSATTTAQRHNVG